MAFVVVYDASALYPNAQRDLLIRIAQGGLVQGKWTTEIIEGSSTTRFRTVWCSVMSSSSKA